MGVVLKQFKESLSENAPTEKDKFLAKLIVRDLTRADRTADSNDSAVSTMFDCAYKWRDIGMWRDLYGSYGRRVGVQGENGLIRAFRAFKFDQIQKRCISDCDRRFLLTSTIS